MSEEERKRRADYLRRRKRKISRRTTVLVLVLLVAVVAGIMAGIFNKTYYVTYNEKSDVDYGVYLKENDFYDETYLGRDYAYIASLIDKVRADFKYEIIMDAKEAVEFKYLYRVDAVIEIKDNASGRVLYAPSFEELPATERVGEGAGIFVKERVLVDYSKYNSIAERFIDTYELQGVGASLVLKLKVDVTSKSDEFDKLENRNDYVAAISIPLTAKTVDVKITSDVPESDSKILSYDTKSISEACAVVAIAFGIFGMVIALLLIYYVNSSRNHDVTYESRKARILAAYKPYIQRLVNHFDTEGFKILMLSEFDEMLGIRDTIQSPILMDENDDRTCSQFLIPTNTNILYVYEIKVGDYDDIYSRAKEDMIVISPEAEYDIPVIEDCFVPIEEVTEPTKEEIPEAEVKTEQIEEEISDVIPEEPAEEISEEIEELPEEIPEELAEDLPDEIEELTEEERRALLVLIHADPEFRFIEKEPEPEPEPEPVVVDAPVDVKVGKEPEEPTVIVAEPELTVTYRGETLVGKPREAAIKADTELTLKYKSEALADTKAESKPLYGPRIELAEEKPYGPRS